MVNIESLKPKQNPESVYDCGPISSVIFSKEERVRFGEFLEKNGLVYRPYPNDPGKEDLELPYGSPIILSKELEKELVEAVIAFRKEATKVVLDKSTIFARVKERAPNIFGQKLGVDKITQQLVDKVTAGMSLPINYDIILAKDKNGKIVPKVVELQLAASAYVGWDNFKTLAAFFAKPELVKNYNRGVGDAVGSLATLKQMVPPDEEILVLDFNPLKGPTAADTLAMAQIIGNENSIPASIDDVFKDTDGKWKVEIKDKDGKVVRTVDAKNILCRSLQGDLDQCVASIQEKYKDKPDEAIKRIQTLYEFFADGDNVNWFWHPSFQEIINKKDADILAKNPETQNHETVTFREDVEVIGPGKYFLKNLGGNSGKGVDFKELKEGDKCVVPPNHVLQELINIAAIQVPVRDPKTGEVTFMLVTVEVRTEPPFSYKRNPDQVDTFFMARLVPRRVPTQNLIFKENQVVTKTGKYILQDLADNQYSSIELEVGDNIPEGFNAWEDTTVMAKTNVGEIMLALQELAKKQGITYQEVLENMGSIGFNTALTHK